MFAAAVGVDHLRFFDRREGGERHRLRFAALENGRAMRAREDADFAGDLAQIVVAAAVDALLLVEDVAAERFFLDVIERLVDRELVRVRKFFEHGRLHFVAQTVDRFAARDFAFGVERGFDPIAGDAVGDFENLRLHFQQRHLAFRLADLRREFLLDANHFARVPMGELERLDEFVFRQFVRRAFDHDDVVLGADVNQIEIALLALDVSRVGDELSVHTADAHGADRARQMEYRKRRARRRRR